MRPWYLFVRTLSAIFLRVGFQCRIQGQENVPAKGGLLIVSNHLSFLDPSLMAAAITREVHFLARKTLFKKNGFGALIRSLNSIPIDQDRPDMNGLRLVIKHLQQGDAVVLFPEGARSPDGKIQPGQVGAGLVALKAGVPILPVYLHGTFEALPRGARGLRCHPVGAIIGAPYTLPPAAKGDKDAYQRASDEMMQKIQQLAP